MDFDLEIIDFEILDASIDAEGIGHLLGENVIEFEGVEYVIKRVNEKSFGEKSVIRVVAQRKFYVDMYGDYMIETISGTYDIDTLMNFILRGSIYRADIQGNFDTITTENFGAGRRMALFTSALERFGAEFELEERRTGKWIVLKNVIGDDGEKQYRYKYNLKGIRREQNTEGLFTYIRGFGKPIEDEEGNPTGQYVVTDEWTSPLVAQFGYSLIEHDPYYNENITQQTTLRRKLMEKLDASQPELVIEVDAVDIDDGTTVGLGDRVLVLYETMRKFDYYTRVTSIRRSYDFQRSVFRTQLTLSSIRRNITDTISNLTLQEQAVSNVVDADGNLQFPSTVNSYATAINEAKKQLTFDDGIRGVNGSQVVRFERNGIYSSQNGGSSFTPSITGAGVNLNNTYGSLPQSKIVDLENDFTLIDNRFIPLEGYLPSGKGDTLSRPLLGPTDDGFFYFDQDVLKMIVWNGVEWTNMDGTAL
ncbi:prophage endopeptidase tail family protein [Bacillus thuringiensis]